MDADNVGLVTDFIRRELQTRTLIVSHKEAVIKMADSLVGASFIRERRTSQALSVDLRGYEQI